MIISRINCIICNNNCLLNNFDLISTIDMVSLNEYNHSELFNLNFVGCNNCGCVQLKNLFEQSIIYEEPIQCIDGPLLLKHNELFANFVFENCKNEKILFEIGGSYGKIAKQIINKYININLEIDYKILEFNIENYPTIENIQYLEGNCESFNFNDYKTIIMSHVFEHLYNPREFIKKISDDNVDNIFISIPDMDNLMKNGDINNLNIFHTFYINTIFLEYIFNLYNYELIKSFNYKESSIFYYFKKNKESMVEPKEYRQIFLLKTIGDFYKDITKRTQILDINKEFFICPAGFYGRNIYNNLNENTKNKVLGFLDGDSFKIGKRLSGTPLNIYDKNYIKNYDKVVVLICSEKHKDELSNELIKYNKNIEIIYN